MFSCEIAKSMLLASCLILPILPFTVSKFDWRKALDANMYFFWPRGR